MSQAQARPDRLSRYLRITVFLAFFILLVSLTSWTMLQRIREQMEQGIGKTMHIVLKATQGAIHTWLRDEIEQVQILLKDEYVRDLIRQLLLAHNRGEDLIGSASQEILREYLVPWMKKHRIKGYLVFAPSGVSIASQIDDNIGIVTPIIKQGQHFFEALKGRPQFVQPFPSERPLPDINGEIKRGVPTMFILAPVFKDTGDLQAVFGIRMYPAGDFSTIAHTVRSGRTGDSYFFNREGKIITEARFDDDLRRIGIIPPRSRSILKLSIADPGGNMMEGYKPGLPMEQMPLTFMAKSALAGESGENLQGYRDYRGVPVVGAWTWDEVYDFGIAYEIDVDEAYQNYFTIRSILIVGLSTLVFFFLVVLHYSETLRRNAQNASEQLTQNEKKLRDITDAVQDAIIMIGSDDSIKFWSGSAEEMFGYKRDEVLNKKLHKLIVPEYYRQEAYAGLNNFYKTGEGPIMGALREVEAMRSDGTRFQAELSINRMSVNDYWWAVGTVRDISERKRVEEALLVSESRLREAQEIANLGHWELDIPSGDLKWSDETYRVFGFDPQDKSVKPELFGDFIHPDDREKVRKAYEFSLDHKTDYNIEYKIMSKYGTLKYVNERCKTEYDEQGNPTRSLGTVQDISRLKQNEIQLFQLSERLQLASNAARVGIWDLDLITGALIWDECMHELYDLDKNDFTPEQLKVGNPGSTRTIWISPERKSKKPRDRAGSTWFSGY